MFSIRCGVRLVPLIPQLKDVCAIGTKSTNSTYLLKLSPCQACHVRKLTNRFSNLNTRTAPLPRFQIYKAYTTSSDDVTKGSDSDTASFTGSQKISSRKTFPVASSSKNEADVSASTGTQSAVSKSQPGEKVTAHGKVATAEKPVVTTPTKSPSGTALRKSRRSKIDWSAVYYANTYVTPIRALNEYMLISADLETLHKYTRRSPFVGVGNMSVYLKQDIEKKAYEVWGGKDNFLKEKERRRLSQEADDITSTIFKKALKQYRKTSRKSEFDRPKPFEGDVRQTMMGSVFKSGTGKVVLYAICINEKYSQVLLDWVIKAETRTWLFFVYGRKIRYVLHRNFANFVVKFVAWLYTGSHSMFAEAIHSAADTFNQLILAVGIHQSIKVPDREHPYGYDNLRYVSSLISGVGIFCIGAGLSWYHGIMGILHPDSVESLHWAIAILTGSLISEGATLMLALNQARATARREGISLLQYVREGYDPSTNVVLLEDMAAVLGVVVAAGCMVATNYTGNVLWDASGSIVIGFLLASVASFIIYTNSQALVGRSIPYYQTAQMCQLLESDRMVRALHDVKATDMGGKYVRFKAEVDFDGKELTRSYLDKVDIDSLLIEMQSHTSIEEVEDFMLRHGEKIVDALGMEVDRLEQKIIKNFPKVRHVDLEIL